jgi:hypothetical protein
MITGIIAKGIRKSRFHSGNSVTILVRIMKDSMDTRMKIVFLITSKTSARKCARKRYRIRYDEEAIMRLPRFFSKPSSALWGQIAVTIPILIKKENRLIKSFLIFIFSADQIFTEFKESLDPNTKLKLICYIIYNRLTKC